MVVKKSGGRVFGAEFTAAEKKAMDIEIKRELAEHIRKNTLEIDALVLWQLHEQLGFGSDRLRRFFDNFSPALEDLIKRYEMREGEEAWLCTKLLKNYGVDLEEWERGDKTKNSILG